MEKTEATKKFERYLKSIGGLENGWRAIPNKWQNPVKYRMFYICWLLGWKDRSNPFRNKIYSRGFFSISDGWLSLVQELIERAIKLGWNKELCQCKEKFGGLRFYINGASKEVHDLISRYENRSYEVCETCGSDKDVSQTTGWITTLCRVHMNMHLNKNNN